MHQIQRVLAINAYIFVSACWARYAIVPAKPGLQRLLIATPVLIVNFMMPLLLDRVAEFIAFVCYLLLLVWLNNFKVLALVIDRGSLSEENLSLFQFVCLYGMPVTAQWDEGSKADRVRSKAMMNQTAGSYPALACKWALNLILVPGIVYLLSISAEKMPLLIIELAQAFMLYWFLGLLMDGPAAVLSWATGMPISPHFNAPYLSTSISDFWSRRWNLTVGNVLRFLCYDPMHEGRLFSSSKSYKKSRIRSAAAVCWTFFVSGVMHELLMWYIEPKAATGEWLLYFSLQGPLVLSETFVKRLARRQGVALSRPVSIGLTITVQLIIAHNLFYPPALRNGLEGRFYREVKDNTRPILRFCGLT